jgi:hypothetical protein
VDEGLRAWHRAKETDRGTQRAQNLDVLLPTRDKTIRLRMVATPEKQLKVLLHRMKILVPNRPKVIENVVEKMA